jgi:two-component system cell cycle response regulator
VDAAIARGRIAAAAVPAALWLGLYAAWLAVRPGGRHALTIFSDTAYLVPIAVAFGLSVLASLRATRGLRLFWAVVAASNLLWLVGESLWSIKELLVGGGVPDVWWTDAAYLGAAGLLPIAIVLGFGPTITMVSRAALLDAALVIGTLTMLWWYFMLRPHPFGTGLGALVPLAYPCLDLLVLGMLLATRLLLSRQGTIALAVFAGGVVSTALADASYAQSAVDHNYYSGAWLDMGWQIQAVLFALAAYVSWRGLDRQSDWLRGREPTRLGTLAVGGGSLAGALVVVAAARASTGSIAGAAGIGVLLVARLWTAVSGPKQPLRDPETGAYGPSTSTISCISSRPAPGASATPFALALVDVDTAAIGTAVDVEVTRRVLIGGREVDAVARLAPGRLAVLMPQVDETVALDAAERIRSAISDSAVANRDVTVSVGVAAWAADTSPERLLETAEAALDRAHRLGGNQARVPRMDDAFGGLVDVVHAVDRRESAGTDHSMLIAALSREVALALDLSEEEATQTYVSGLLHDIGKVGLPDWLLRKSGPLSRREWEAMTTHAERGAMLLSEVGAIREAAPIVAAHHERWDGSGYPFARRRALRPRARRARTHSGSRLGRRALRRARIRRGGGTHAC